MRRSWLLAAAQQPLKLTVGADMKPFGGTSAKTRAPNGIDVRVHTPHYLSARLARSWIWRGPDRVCDGCGIRQDQPLERFGQQSDWKMEKSWGSEELRERQDCAHLTPCPIPAGGLCIA